tara:strand:- start:217 stop:396 length:180 start_codon:yes stop_codon:yes gene_type:complete
LKYPKPVQENKNSHPKTLPKFSVDFGTSGILSGLVGNYDKELAHASSPEPSRVEPVKKA